MKRLVELTLRSDFNVDDAVAGRILADLSRSDLRRYLAALRRALRRSSVSVAVEGRDEDAVRGALRERYPERNIVVTAARGTGGGLTFSLGDDVLDASVVGRVRAVIQELGKGAKS